MRKNTKKLSTLGLALALLLSIFTTSAYAVSLPTSEVTSEPVTGETSQLDDSIIAEATTEDATDTTNLLDGVIGEEKLYHPKVPMIINIGSWNSTEAVHPVGLV